MKTRLALAVALMLTACGDPSQDHLSANLAAAEGRAEINDADLNGVIDADREVVNMAEAAPSPSAPPREIALADVPDPVVEVPTRGPSFDCSNAWREAERMVCEDADLAALDRAMAASYFRALKAADPARAATLQQGGAAFIRDRNRCPDPQCVADTYQDRLDEIAEIMGAR